MASTRTRVHERAGGTRREKPGDWRLLTAADVMQSDVVTVAADTPMPEVERMLAENRITGMPVTDKAGHIVGVLSVRDLIDRYAEDPDVRPRSAGFYGFDAGELEGEELAFDVPAESTETAGSLMTKEVLTVPVDAPLREVARAMVRHGVHRLLVTEAGKTAGIVSTMDLLAAAAK